MWRGTLWLGMAGSVGRGKVRYGEARSGKAGLVGWGSVLQDWVWFGRSGQVGRGGVRYGMVG